MNIIPGAVLALMATTISVPRVVQSPAATAPNVGARSVSGNVVMRPCLEHVQTLTEHELWRRSPSRSTVSGDRRIAPTSYTSSLLFMWDSPAGPRDPSRIAGYIAAGSYGILLRRVGDDYYVQCPFSKRSGWITRDVIARTVWLEEYTLRDCAQAKR
jgi:hypothetical protein